jgi:hypothetical protein
MTVDETARTGGSTPGPGWLDDPFHRSGQRWWDGQQWTARTRSPSGEPSRDHRRPNQAAQASRSGPSSTGTADPLNAAGHRPFPRRRPEVLIIIGVFVVFTVIGLLAPSAEESGALAEGYPRAAYWACADLLTQRLGPASDLEFPGDSTATITQDGATWTVSGRVAIVSEQPVGSRTWSCTVTVDDEGVWRGTAALD